MGWFAEKRRTTSDGSSEDWTRLGGPYPTQERAKSECRQHFVGSFSVAFDMEFRIVRDDERETVDQICRPPHGWRMRWVDAVAPAAQVCVRAEV